MTVNAAAKLGIIATLPERELRGWWAAIFIDHIRPAFDGEADALKQRARQLGLVIKEK